MAKDWRNVDRLAMAIVNGASNVSEGERAEKDFYATDPKCMRDLLGVMTLADKVWEPACGMGHLSGVLKEAGYDVRESDIVDRYGNEVKDFLFMPEAESWDGDIVTNPPYSMAQEFVETALRVVTEGRKVAMFLKLTFLEGKKRKELFQITPPQCVYVYSERQRCAANGDFSTIKSSAVCYAWFVWEKGYNGETIVKWI